MINGRSDAPALYPGSRGKARHCSIDPGVAGNLYKSQRSQHVKQEIYNGKKEVFKRGFYLLGEQPGN